MSLPVLSYPALILVCRVVSCLSLISNNMPSFQESITLGISLRVSRAVVHSYNGSSLSHQRQRSEIRFLFSLWLVYERWRDSGNFDPSTLATITRERHHVPCFAMWYACHVCWVWRIKSIFWLWMSSRCQMHSDETATRGVCKKWTARQERAYVCWLASNIVSIKTPTVSFPRCR
jgi:hypothetical protein